VCLDACRKFGTPLISALDCGCGPGRTALELTTQFHQVEAYDYSQDFIDMLIEKKTTEVGALLTRGK